ncbi:uncharacterized protein KRP23_13471 [Phytophthora ramorum]|uniref:uncharacterized protein n=1 Tax=Phytophthora ramorum TaxID=164328 RepID=UPI0030AE73E3|nr:hypothetical protein KRP23_13471 [Phytophthora ramorum]KAH7497393.1 hypothetical protein KRP22_12456 [Phytophthora ramorum]
MHRGASTRKARAMASAKCKDDCSVAAFHTVDGPAAQPRTALRTSVGCDLRADTVQKERLVSVCLCCFDGVHQCSTDNERQQVPPAGRVLPAGEPHAGRDRMLRAARRDHHEERAGRIQFARGHGRPTGLRLPMDRRGKRRASHCHPRGGSFQGSRGFARVRTHRRRLPQLPRLLLLGDGPAGLRCEPVHVRIRRGRGGAGQHPHEGIQQAPHVLGHEVALFGPVDAFTQARYVLP